MLSQLHDLILKFFRGHPSQKQVLAEEMIRLFIMYSPSGQERGVAEYCSGELSKCGFVSTLDSVGNVIASRGNPAGGKFLCLNAHMDTVQKPSDIGIRSPGSIAYDVEMDAIHTGDRFCMGGDDKAGVGIILAIAKTTDLPMKVLFTVGEEHGAVGINALNKGFFGDVFACITLDRRGGCDIIQSYCGRVCAPDEFVNLVKDIGLTNTGVEFTVESGSFADTYVISHSVPCINMSAGYYNPHSNKEFVMVNEAYNVMITCIECIKRADELESAILSAPADWQKEAHDCFHGTRWNFENLRPTKCTRDACLFDYDKDARIKKREKKIAKTCHINM